MATTTPNFGWAVPTSTDLVKDGAVAIETLGDSIDASLVDLKGGTTGQVLSKASNTDMDFTWVTDAAGDIQGVTAGVGISGGGTSGTVTVTNSMATAIDAKGDLIGGTGADTFARLAVGANGTVLTADSAETTGLKWATPASGSTFVGARVFDTAAQSINNATYTALTWDSESYDTDAFHSTSSNTSRFTIPTGKGGKYLLNCQMLWQSSSNTGARTISLYKNGAIILEREFSLSTRGNLSMAIDSVQNAVATDYFEIFVYQTNGSAINADKTSAYSEFSISYLGA